MWHVEPATLDHVDCADRREVVGGEDRRGELVPAEQPLGAACARLLGEVAGHDLCLVAETEQPHGSKVTAAPR